jgi:hypothetical protein
MAVFIPIIRDKKHLLPRAFLRKKKGLFAEGIPLELLVRLSRLMSGQRK